MDIHEAISIMREALREKSELTPIDNLYSTHKRLSDFCQIEVTDNIDQNPELLNETP